MSAFTLSNFILADTIVNNETKFNYLQGFEEGQRYYWRIASINDNNSDTSDYTPMMSFKPDNSTPLHFLEVVKESMFIHPNPAIDEILFVSNSIGNIKIIDNSSKIVYSGSTRKGENRIDVRELKKGFYTCVLEEGNKIYKSMNHPRI